MPTWGQRGHLVLAIPCGVFGLLMVALAWSSLTDGDYGEACCCAFLAAPALAFAAWWVQPRFGVKDGVLYFRQLPFAVKVSLGDVVAVSVGRGGVIPNPTMACLCLTLLPLSRWEEERHVRCRATSRLRWFGNVERVEALAQWVSERCGATAAHAPTGTARPDSERPPIPDEMPRYGQPVWLLTALMCGSMSLFVLVLTVWALVDVDVGPADFGSAAMGFIGVYFGGWIAVAFARTPFGIEDDVLFFREGRIPLREAVPLNKIASARVGYGGRVPIPFVVSAWLHIPAKSRWELESDHGYMATERLVGFGGRRKVEALVDWINAHCGDNAAPAPVTPSDTANDGDAPGAAGPSATATTSTAVAPGLSDRRTSAATE